MCDICCCCCAQPKAPPPKVSAPKKKDPAPQSAAKFPTLPLCEPKEKERLIGVIEKAALDDGLTALKGIASWAHAGAELRGSARARLEPTCKITEQVTPEYIEVRKSVVDKFEANPGGEYNKEQWEKRKKQPIDTAVIALYDLGMGRAWLKMYGFDATTLSADESAKRAAIEAEEKEWWDRHCVHSTKSYDRAYCRALKTRKVGSAHVAVQGGAGKYKWADKISGDVVAVRGGCVLNFVYAEAPTDAHDAKDAKKDVVLESGQDRKNCAKDFPKNPFPTKEEFVSNGLGTEEAWAAYPNMPGAAAGAGLQEGDVLVLIEYTDSPHPVGALGGPTQFRYAFSAAKDMFEGSKVKITYLRTREQINAWNAAADNPEMWDQAEAASGLDRMNSSQHGSSPVGRQMSSQRMGSQSSPLGRSGSKKDMGGSPHSPAGAGFEVRAEPSGDASEFQKRIKMMGNLSPCVAYLTIGRDRLKSQEQRKANFERIAECEELNVGGLCKDTLSDFLTNPDKSTDIARDYFTHVIKGAGRDPNASNAALTHDEMVDVFFNLGKKTRLPTPTPAEAETLFKQVDINSDKSVTFDEFYPWFRRKIIALICELEEQYQAVKQGTFKQAKLDTAKEEELKKLIIAKYAVKPLKLGQLADDDAPFEAVGYRWKVELKGGSMARQQSGLGRNNSKKHLGYTPAQHKESYTFECLNMASGAGRSIRVAFQYDPEVSPSDLA